MNINDLTITRIDTITAFELDGTTYKFTMDELQNTTISQSEEKTDITGKQGRKITSLKRNKTVTISGSNGLISSGLLELQTGGKFEKNSKATVLWTDYLTVANNEATTTRVATGTAGAEIDSLYIKNTDGTLGTKLTQGATAADGTFAYDPDTKKLTFSGVTDDSTTCVEIVAIYNCEVDAATLTNESENYSGKCTIYIDAAAENKCGDIYHVQFYIPKADFSGEFSIEMGDSQSAHSFEIEALAGGCGCGTGNDLWTLTIFGENAE